MEVDALLRRRLEADNRRTMERLQATVEAKTSAGNAFSTSNSASWVFMSWACLPFQCLTTVVTPAIVNQVILGY